jgi:CRP-like cAMP-binding protein
LPLHARHSDGALRRVSFFDGWTDDELEHFERIIDRARFRAGDVLITEGRSGQAFLVLTAGEAEVRRGGKAFLRLEPGDHVGEMSLLDGSPASATVVATSDVEALVLYQRDFDNLLETIPSLGRRLLASLARWVRDAARQDS